MGTNKLMEKLICGFITPGPYFFMVKNCLKCLLSVILSFVVQYDHKIRLYLAEEIHCDDLTSGAFSKKCFPTSFFALYSRRVFLYSNWPAYRFIDVSLFNIFVNLRFGVNNL